MNSRSIIAGAAYFGIVFAAGFVLGAFRVALVAPKLGEAAGVALELPFMLAISWTLCRMVIARLALPAERMPRIVMGASAFAYLIVAEVGVSVWLFGRTVSDHVDQYRTIPGLPGLARQLAFAAFPRLQSIRGLVG